MTCCRWCGTVLDRAPTGRPPAWCSSACRHRHVETFDTTHYSGDVRFVESCQHGCEPVIFDMLGPVMAPGAWAEAATLQAGAVHGHPVEVVLTPIAAATGVQDYTGVDRQEVSHG